MKNEIYTPSFPEKNKEMLPNTKIEVNDTRDPHSNYKFNLSEFLLDMKIFMDPDKFSNAVNNNETNFRGKYGKLSEFGTAESENFIKDLQKSSAIRLVIENIAKTINGNLLERTLVHVYMIWSKNLGSAITLFFNKDGKFLSQGQTIIMNKRDIKQIKTQKNIK